MKAGIGAATNGRHAVRVMVMVKATAASEAGVMPDTALLEAMGRFNQELVDAGVMLAGEGLHPTSRGARSRAGPPWSSTASPRGESR